MCYSWRVMEAMKMGSVIFEVLLLFCCLTLVFNALITMRVKAETEDLENRLKNTEVDTLSETEDLENRLKNTEVDTLRVKPKTEDLETRLKNTELEIEQLKSREETGVIFSATLPNKERHVGPFNTDITLIFSNVLVNMGCAYHPFAGIFTAPVAGVYYFTMFYHAGGAQTAVMMLYKNSEAIVVTSDQKTTHDGADNGGNAAFLQLQPGDYVYVRLLAGNHVWSGPQSTFSGFLVKAE